MSFFDEDPMHLPADAEYYFDVCVVNIAIRRSLGGQFEDIWDLEQVQEPRPIVYHFFLDEDHTFDSDRRWDIEIFHHCVLEVSDSLGVSFFSTESSDFDFFIDGDEFIDPDDFWRF